MVRGGIEAGSYSQGIIRKTRAMLAVEAREGAPLEELLPRLHHEEGLTRPQLAQRFDLKTPKAAGRWLHAFVDKPRTFAQVRGAAKEANMKRALGDNPHETLRELRDQGLSFDSIEAWIKANNDIVVDAATVKQWAIADGLPTRIPRRRNDVTPAHRNEKKVHPHGKKEPKLSPSKNGTVRRFPGEDLKEKLQAFVDDHLSDSQIATRLNTESATIKSRTVKNWRLRLGVKRSGRGRPPKAVKSDLPPNGEIFSHNGTAQVKTPEKPPVSPARNRPARRIFPRRTSEDRPWRQDGPSMAELAEIERSLGIKKAFSL